MSQVDGDQLRSTKQESERIRLIQGSYGAAASGSCGSEDNDKTIETGNMESYVRGIYHGQEPIDTRGQGSDGGFNDTIGESSEHEARTAFDDKSTLYSPIMKSSFMTNMLNPNITHHDSDYDIVDNGGDIDQAAADGRFAENEILVDYLQKCQRRIINPLKILLIIMGMGVVRSTGGCRDNVQRVLSWIYLIILFLMQMGAHFMSTTVIIDGAAQYTQVTFIVSMAISALITGFSYIYAVYHFVFNDGLDTMAASMEQTFLRSGNLPRITQYGDLSQRRMAHHLWTILLVSFVWCVFRLTTEVTLFTNECGTEGSWCNLSGDANKAGLLASIFIIIAFIYRAFIYGFMSAIYVIQCTMVLYDCDAVRYNMTQRDGSLQGVMRKLMAARGTVAKMNKGMGIVIGLQSVVFVLFTVQNVLAFSEINKKDPFKHPAQIVNYIFIILRTISVIIPPMVCVFYASRVTSRLLSFRSIAAELLVNGYRSETTEQILRFTSFTSHFPLAGQLMGFDVSPTFTGIAVATCIGIYCTYMEVQ